MTGLPRRRSPRSFDVHEQATTDAPITMATMELEHARLAQVNRNQRSARGVGPGCCPGVIWGQVLGIGLGLLRHRQGSPREGCS